MLWVYTKISGQIKSSVPRPSFDEWSYQKMGINKPGITMIILKQNGFRKIWSQSSYAYSMH